jgi:hypothetical protein
MKIAIVTSFLSLLASSSALAESAPAPATSVPGPATAAATTSSVPLASATTSPGEPQTVTGSLQNGPKYVSGWFVAPTFTTSKVDGSLAYSPGIRAGIYLNQRVSVGVAAHAVGNGDSYYYGTPVRSLGAYGGILFQYIVESNRLLHTTLESTLGSGRWCVEISEERDGCMGRNLLVFEPAANLELNVAKHVRLAAGVGYRLAVAGDGTGPSTERMSSLVARTSLIFGSF